MFHYTVEASHIFNGDKDKKKLHNSSTHLYNGFDI